MIRKYVLMSAMLLAVLFGATGCTTTLFLSNLISAGAGYFLGSATTVTQRECFLNGVPVDCSTVP